MRRVQGRTAFRWLLLPTIGLTVSVVYTRYHYTADAAAGLLVAFGADQLVNRLLPGRIHPSGIQSGRMLDSARPVH